MTKRKKKILMKLTFLQHPVSDIAVFLQVLNPKKKKKKKKYLNSGTVSEFLTRASSLINEKKSSKEEQK